jgi:hypothetical protein
MLCVEVENILLIRKCSNGLFEGGGNRTSPDISTFENSPLGTEIINDDEWVQACVVSSVHLGIVVES